MPTNDEGLCRLPWEASPALRRLLTHLVGASGATVTVAVGLLPRDLEDEGRRLGLIADGPMIDAETGVCQVSPTSRLEEELNRPCVGSSLEEYRARVRALLTTALGGDPQ